MARARAKSCRHSFRRTPWVGLLSATALVLAALCSVSNATAFEREQRLRGLLADAEGEPVVGAMVTLRSGDPLHARTVFSDDGGRFEIAAPDSEQDAWLRVRRIGWREIRRPADSLEAGSLLRIAMQRERDPKLLAEQLPANHWYARVLERVADPTQKEQLKRQCTFCHQQGNAATRVQRSEEEWRKVLNLMGRMGGMLSRDLRESLPGIFNDAYDPATAIPALAARAQDPEVGLPSSDARRSAIDEWELGLRSSMQHDLAVHPDGRIYSVDMSNDMLYRLDPRVPGGLRESWSIPRGDMPLGGVFRSIDTPLNPNSNSHVGPHSLQIAPDGSVWITLALGNQLTRFDPTTESFTTHHLTEGFYPHTLRIDGNGRIWYTISASNHIGMHDPGKGESREIRLPAASIGQALTLRAMPALLWLGRHFDLRAMAADSEDEVRMPIPYGIDIAPDGAIWFSQLNQHRIGRIDPETFEVEMVDTPFAAPRRLRFDSQGTLWIPSFSDSLLASFDPATRTFETWPLPIEPAGSEVPYALNIDRSSDVVWICGTNSDSLIRFEPQSERFTVFPLPTRVTYTREIDFDGAGGIWASNSNSPAWQIETGVPRVLRLVPKAAERH